MSFIRTKGNKEAKLTGKKKRKENEQSKAPRSKVPKMLDGDITSESEDENEEQESISDSELETANEKRTRLAKDMLQKIKEKVPEEGVESYLQNELLEKKGQVFHEIADEFECPSKEDLKFGRWGRLKAINCLAVTSDKSFVFSGSKDGCIVKWSVQDCKKVGLIKKGKNPKKTQMKEPQKSHFGAINALVITSDNKYLASGGEDKVVNVWSVDSLQHVHQFCGHRAAITSLVFQQGSSTLYSGSKDKSIKLWSLSEMAYIETLWGHEDQVCSLDALSQERVVSAGGRDGSVRLWKIPEESHLVFQTSSGCTDCVSYLDSKHFISASSLNKICLWASDKKKPLFTLDEVHKSTTHQTTNGVLHGESLDEPLGQASQGHNFFTSASEMEEQWISALQSIKHTDIFASGSRDGYVRFFKIIPPFKSIQPLFNVPLAGFINALSFSRDGSFIVAATSQEHRLGSWFKRDKTVKNAICIIPLKRKNKEIKDCD